MSAPGVVDGLLRDTAPRHLELARELLREVQSGVYPVGAHLPPESDLCAQYGLSRYAVRQAVQKLCDLGIVVRRAGIGTRVVSSQPQARYTQVMDSLGDLTRYAQGTTFRVQFSKSIKVNRQQPDDLGLAAGSKWLHIHGLRFGSGSSDQAIAMVDFYVAEDFGAAADLERTSDVPVHVMIEEKYHCRITRVEQEIQGTLIRGQTAEELQVADGSPGLRISRSYFVQERLVEKTIGVHPADRFSYATAFNLSPGYV